MSNKRAALVILFLCGWFLSIPFSPAAAGADISKRLQETLKQAPEGESVKVWIYFKDKETPPDAFQKAATRFTPRALLRRVDSPVDWYDLPVNEDYINGVIDAGGEAVKTSRWLNAVSARLTADGITRVAAIDYVEKVEPVEIFTRNFPPELPQPQFAPAIDSSVYGPSYTQNHMLGADSLHQLGLNGNGVLLAFFDTGYIPTHQAFDSMHILDVWNFIDGNDNVTWGTDVNQTEHGTVTLSACGGFEAGQLVGPAFSADYILAETEYQNLEIQIEEDYWVAAAEWADSLGADIISTSLGYSDWYTYAAMDGNTAVTSIAADIAASRGILVVISAGNEGNVAWHYISAPADADSVIAVGAVSSNELIMDFSSYGPTSDGRLKPEMVAMGSSVRCARDEGGYFFKSGTSLSAPLIAGGAALVLQAIPSLRGNPMEIRQRLIESADRYGNPDFQYGYGLPDLVLAAGFGLRLLPLARIDVRNGVDTLISIKALAPPGETVAFEPLEIPSGSIFTDYGDGTASLLYTGDVSLTGLRQYLIAATAGVYTDTLPLTINTIISSEVVTVGPNPCTDNLNIFVNETFPGGYKIEIFTLSGELVYQALGQESLFIWPAVNQQGEKVGAGVYLIRFSADAIERKVKIYKM